MADRRLQPRGAARRRRLIIDHTGATMAASTYSKMFPVSWQELHRDAKALAWRLHGLKPWRAIVAITRGGLVPAAIVARELDLRIIDTISVKSYDHQSIGATEILKPAALSATPDAPLLIIDDLVDTGATAKVVRDLLPGALFATVYAKPAGKPLVETYVTEVSQDTWIMFPWDTELQIAKTIAESNRA
jgi:xanthine phosphoribosyltransferase